MDSARVYCYEFDPASSQSVDETAGHYASIEVMRPLRMETMDNLPACLAGEGIELRSQEDLLGLHAAVAKSTLAFPSIRRRNANDERVRVPVLEARRSPYAS